MDSILNWYKEEGKIFQGGSGAGLNLSRIRSSKELLSSGGTASGPVSLHARRRRVRRARSSPVAPPVARPRWSSSTSTTPTSRSSSRPRRARRTRSARCATPGSTWTSAARTSSPSSTRTPTTRSGSTTSSCGRSRTAPSSGCARATTTRSSTPSTPASCGTRSPRPRGSAPTRASSTTTRSTTGTPTPRPAGSPQSNPCSEYMSLDNSSCNLASLNLLKFLRDDDTFDAATFEKVVELVITAMDISICFADFPTEPIGETTRDYRQLGIGYANLGALLMATGHGYDSEGGRALAASITSLLTGAAYKRSAELAAVVGPYDGYARNADAHKRVMRKHQAANDEIRTLDAMDRSIHQLATKAWDDVVKLGEKNGYRNAQASVLAPTGTIGFMMDCDTTGIEPDFSLVKFKKLVGGGSMQIVNLTIPRALRKLGYTDETSRGDRRVHRRQGPRHRRPRPEARALRGLRHRDGRARDLADGPRADDGRRAAVPLRRDLQDGQPAGDGDGRGDRGRLPAGLEARPEGARGLPRQLQGRPAALRRRVDRQGRRGRQGRGGRRAGRSREGRRVPPGPQAPARSVGRRRRRRSPSAGPRATSPPAPTRTTASASCSSSSASRARRWPA